MRIVGDAAESYERIGETTYVFRLRRGIVWHHGRDLTADDVRYTFERILDPKTGSTRRSVWLIIDRIETPDRFTVRFITRRPFAPFLRYMATPDFSAIIPRELVERYGDLQQHMSGTGPFMLDRFVPENVVVLKRNPRYFEAGLPRLDGIEFRIIPDQATRLAALRAGGIQYMWSPDPLIEAQVRGMPGVVALAPRRYAAQMSLAFNQTRPPFSDVRVRRAASVGIDRTAIIASVLRGRGAISTKIPPADAPFGYSGDARGLPYYLYDPGRARRLLAEAGYAGGLDTTLEVPPRFPIVVQTAEVMKEQLAAAGIRVSLRQMEWGAALGNFVHTSYEGMSMIPTVWQPDPDAHVYDIFHSGSAINLGKFSDPYVDRLLDEGRTTLNQDARVQIYQELQRYVADRAYMLFPYAYDNTELIRDVVKGYIPIPGTGPGSRSRIFFREAWLGR
jgi:peptide/nickel transport system substrate-binding protein